MKTWSRQRSGVPQQTPMSQCPWVKLGLLGPEQMAGMPLIQQSQSLLEELGILRLRNRVRRRSLNSRRVPVKISLVQGRWHEARPQGFAKHSANKIMKSFDARRETRPQFLDRVYERLGYEAANAVGRRFISDAAVRDSLSS